MNACLNGSAVAEDIDVYIQSWNNRETDLELHEYLGFTESEYDKWLEDSGTLNTIISARKSNNE